MSTVFGPRCHSVNVRILIRQGGAAAGGPVCPSGGGAAGSGTAGLECVSRTADTVATVLWPHRHRLRTVPTELRGDTGACQTGFQLPCSSQDSSSILFWSGLPAGTKGERQKLAKTIAGLGTMACPAAPALGLQAKSAASAWGNLVSVSGQGWARRLPTGCAPGLQTAGKEGWEEQGHLRQKHQHKQMQEGRTCRVSSETGKWTEQRL